MTFETNFSKFSSLPGQAHEARLRCVLSRYFHFETRIEHIKIENSEPGICHLDGQRSYGSVYSLETILIAT